jgi:hypothetical protein
MAPGYLRNTTRHRTSQAEHLTAKVWGSEGKGKADFAAPYFQNINSVTDTVQIIVAVPPNPYPDLKAQKAFEKGLADKTLKQTGDIILYDNRIVLYKMESDVMMYVVGSLDENEVLLYNVILALRDSLHLLFK